MSKTIWIQLLPDNVKREIEKDLRIALEAIGNDLTDQLEEREIEGMMQEGMDSRLCDLSDTIDINKYIDMLPKLDDGLLKAIDYLQRNDSNGTYDEMIEEYALGDIDLETIKSTLTDVLLNWVLDTLPDDAEQVKELQDMLRLIL